MDKFFYSIRVVLFINAGDFVDICSRQGVGNMGMGRFKRWFNIHKHIITNNDVLFIKYFNTYNMPDAR